MTAGSAERAPRDCGGAQQPLSTRHRRALAVLAVLAAAAAAGVSFAMYPGGVSPDGAFQLAQIRGTEPYNDWQPVIMTWTWHQLADLFGTVSALLFAQLFIAWLCAVLTVYVVLKFARSVPLAACGLFLLVMPNLMNILGVFYKDVQMALALYTAVLLMFLVRLWPRWRWAFAVLACAALVYAALVRKNSAIAVLPIIVVFVIWFLRARCEARAGRARTDRGRARADGAGARAGAWGTGMRRGRVVAVLAAVLVIFGATVLGADHALITATKATKNSQFTQVFIDDLVFGMPREALEHASGPEAEKRRLLEAREACAERSAREHHRIIWDAYWKCYGYGKDGPYTEVRDPDAVIALWKELIPQHLDAYVRYRTATTVKFLTETPAWSVALAPKTAEAVGLPPAHPHARAAHSACADAAVRAVPWMFHGITALLACAVGAVVSLLRRTRSLAACAVFTSVILYMLTYVPTAPANLYRYYYWPYAAAYLGWLIVAMVWMHRRKFTRPTPRSHRLSPSC